jgi:hypothetical protein
MKTVMNYFTGFSGLILVAVLSIIAIMFFAIFNMAYTTALFVLAIVAILIVPYYFGKQDLPEKKGNYSLRKIK